MPRDPDSAAISSAAAKLKVPYWKPGYHRTTLDDVEARSRSVREAVVPGIVALSKEYGVTAGFHNHSGDYFGSAVWDTRAIISDSIRSGSATTSIPRTPLSKAASPAGASRRTW